MTAWFSAAPRRVAASLAAIVVAVFAQPASAATPAEICRSFDPSATPTSDASGSALRGKAEEVESALANRRGAVITPPSLDVTTDAAQPAPADVTASARYCAAAGEAMRRDPRGSDMRAQAYLLTAFRMAETAGDTVTAARAAYRLGLVAVNAAPALATRGAKRGGTRAAIADTAEVDAIGSGVCGSLSAATPGTQSPQYLSSLALECAWARASAGGDLATAALAQLRLARLSLGLLDKAPERREFLAATIEESIGRGLVAARTLPPSELRGELTGRLLETALDAGVGKPAEWWRTAEAMRAEAGNEPAEAAFAEALMARLSLAEGDEAQAAAAANRAIFLESQRPRPLRLADWYLILADAEPAQRHAHTDAAYRALEALRPALPATDPLTDESTFALRMRRVFEKAADVTLASSSADDQAAIGAAQAIIESYREAEIQSIFGNECVPPRVAFTPGDLAAGEVLLYPILLPDRLEMIVAERPQGGAARYRRLEPNRSVNRAQVAALVEEVNLAMSYGDNDAWQGAALQLDRLLVEPIAADLGPDSTLIVIPDGPLRALPFAALRDAQGRFLVERTRIAVSPALGYSQPGGAEHEASLRVVAASLEKEVDLVGGAFPALTGTAEEARIAAAAGKAGGSRLLTDFTRAELASALAGGAIDVLHLATHASFNGGSDRSFIVANGEAIQLTDLRGMIAGNLARGGALDLIVLSACETAVGDDEASMGLAGAAVQAGAASAIASLWQVADVGTAQLMREFYARYAVGDSKADALRGAQLALIQGGTYADPNIWAAFTLLGGWR